MKLDSPEIVTSSLGRAKGLMFRKRLERGMILVLPRKTRLNASIHTFFMNFPIDVLFLDERKRVVDKALNVKPWTINITPKEPAKYVVELPAGSAEKVKIGEIVEW